MGGPRQVPTVTDFEYMSFILQKNKVKTQAHVNFLKNSNQKHEIYSIWSNLKTMEKKTTENNKKLAT